VFGIGRIGGALAIALSRAGYQVENLVFRDRTAAELIASEVESRPQLLRSGDISRIQSEIVFITTPDQEIGEADSILSKSLIVCPKVFHTSGSLSSNVLGKLKAKGCSTGSLHPLISISDPIVGSNAFKGAYFCIEGDKEATDIGMELVSALGGNSFTIDTKLKALYHASAVMAAGHLVALIDGSIEMLQACGLEGGQAKSILMPLIRSTVDNLERQPAEDALTGSFARLDIEAFDRHVDSFAGRVSNEVRELFFLLGERSLELVERRRADPDKIRQFRDRISVAKQQPR
jgi:predicted short-subunit dehydrogenase-like oxidoreductase (DUF2520 family)